MRDVTGQLGYLLRLAQNNVWRDLVATFEPFGVKPQQYAAMARLEASPGETLDMLAKGLGIRAPNLVAMIEDLVARGFITKRRAAHDRRRGILELTADGVALLRTLKAADDRHERALVALLGAEGATALAEYLRRLGTFSSASAKDEQRRRA